MIHEPKTLSQNDLKDVVERQKYKDSGGIIHCGHDFWDSVKGANYGDVLLCNRCHQYFAKIKHLPWVVNNPSFRYTHHLPQVLGDSEAWFCPVEVRITD